MMKPIIAAAALSLLAGPAFAFQCPADMADIDEALQTASLSEAEMARVQDLRERGEALHAAGDHQASVDALAEAKTLLGIE